MTLVQPAEHFRGHPNQITQGKTQLQESAANVFDTGGSKALRLPGRRGRLVQLPGAVMARLDHDGGGILRRDIG
jgi:hypothetical protein